MKDPYVKIKEKLAEERSLLYFDIETRPMKAWVWGIGKQYISDTQIAEESKVISIQWMFEGDKKVSYLTWNSDHDDAFMLLAFRKAIEDAKVAVSQNGKAFDHKVLNWRMNVQGLPPLHRMTIFDTLSLSRSAFRPPSHKLNYRSTAYGLGGKLRMTMPDWIDVVDDKPGALKKMVEYGCKDILDLRSIFWKELPYYQKLPADLTLLIRSKRMACPVCTKAHQARFHVVPMNRKNVPHYRCENCKHEWRV